MITDGYVGVVPPPKGCSVEAPITHDGCADNLSAIGAKALFTTTNE